MQALEGIRVLDFGQFLAGPLGPMVMADLGADVIKVEPTRGDGMRGAVPGSFMGCQRGKRCISIDLKQPEGLQIALDLVATADIVHHNMTKGTADRLGIGYDACKAVNPDVIYCNNYMYGPVGPLSELGGLDPLGQAVCGIEFEQGPVEEGNPPNWYRYGHGDAASAMPSVVASLMALYHRKRTGEGQSVWSSIFYGSMLFTSDSYLGPDGEPSPRPKLDKNQTGFGAVYRIYETSAGWLAVAAVKPEHWPALCGALGRADLTEDPRFADAESRDRNRSELEGIFESVFSTDLAINWRRALRVAGVPCELCTDTSDGETILFDDDLVGAGLVAEYDHPVFGNTRQAGSMITLGDTPGRIERPAPLVGEHTREILESLGVDDATMTDYRERGVVYWPDENYPFPM